MANLTLRYLDELSFVLNHRKHGLSAGERSSSVGDLLNPEEDKYSRVSLWSPPSHGRRVTIHWFLDATRVFFLGFDFFYKRSVHRFVPVLARLTDVRFVS